jgi:hypothetical protein
MKLPPVGQSLLSLEGQRYTLTGSKPYTRVDGTPSTIMLWSTPCKTCGTPFEITSGVNPEMRRWARNCKTCRVAFVPEGSTAEHIEAARNARWSEQLKEWHAEAKAVKAGKVALRPVKLVGVEMGDTGDMLLSFKFNDRQTRGAIYRDGAVRMMGRVQADFTEFLETLAELYEAELAKALFS